MTDLYYFVDDFLKTSVGLAAEDKADEFKRLCQALCAAGIKSRDTGQALSEDLLLLAVRLIAEEAAQAEAQTDGDAVPRQVSQDTDIAILNATGSRATSRTSRYCLATDDLQLDEVFF